MSGPPPPLRPGLPAAQPQPQYPRPNPPRQMSVSAGPPVPPPPASVHSQHSQSTVSSTPGDASRSDNAISLKVMRLRKPELQSCDAVYLEPGDPFYGAADTGPGFGLQPDMLLPPSIGQIFVGETFRCYISLHNNSSAPVRNVCVKLELITQSAKVPLLDNSNSPVRQFPPGTNRDFIVDYALTEEGNHTLMCQVTWADDSSEQPPPAPQQLQQQQQQQYRRIRKMFKFQVAKVLSLKTVKIFTLRDHVFIVLELMNLIPMPLSLALVRLDAEPGFEVVADHSTHNKGSVCFESFNPDEVRRFLFELAPRGGQLAGPPPGGTSALGKLHIEWRTNMGELGQIATNAIQHRGLERKAVEATGVTAEDQVRLQVPFMIRGSIRNHAQTPLDATLVLQAEQAYPLLFSGPARRPLPIIPPGESETFELELVPLAAGIQGVSGVELIDNGSGAVHSLGLLNTVFVEP
eukprot:Hpha_TRINITY_DN1903_c0_g1::TRINITY_DN1903_c0_g1_i1::g.30913::m.30913/K20310/TRAPPC13; trafficking protein particle complex subunit 13